MRVIDDSRAMREFSGGAPTDKRESERGVK